MVRFCSYRVRPVEARKGGLPVSPWQGTHRAQQEEEGSHVRELLAFTLSVEPRSRAPSCERVPDLTSHLAGQGRAEKSSVEPKNTAEEPPWLENGHSSPVGAPPCGEARGGAGTVVRCTMNQEEERKGERGPPYIPRAPVNRSVMPTVGHAYKDWRPFRIHSATWHHEELPRVTAWGSQFIFLFQHSFKLRKFITNSF